MSEAISLTTVQSLAYQVARRYHIRGMDQDDLEQELLAHVHEHTLHKVCPDGAPKQYVRSSMVNRARSLLRSSTRFCRSAVVVCPYEDLYQSPGPTPEEELEATEAIQEKFDSLGFAQRRQLAREFVYMLAGHQGGSLDVLLKSIVEGETAMALSEEEKKALPMCHALVDKTLGYAKGDKQCQACPAKFTCLPAAIDAGTLREPVDVDPEVQAVQKLVLTEAEVNARIKKRQHFLSAGQKLPLGLLMKAARTQLDIGHDEYVRATKSSEKVLSVAPTKVVKKLKKKKVVAKVLPKKKLKKKVVTKVAVKKKRLKKKAAPKSAPKSAPKKERKVSERKVSEDGSLLLTNTGRKMYRPRTMTWEQMREKLDQLNTTANTGGRRRFPFDLSVGMSLVLHFSDGEVVVKLTKQGFMWGGQNYGSISSAFCAALGRSVSGFDLFDMSKRRNCEIRGRDVPGRSFHYGKHL